MPSTVLLSEAVKSNKTRLLLTRGLGSPRGEIQENRRRRIIRQTPQRRQEQGSVGGREVKLDGRVRETSGGCREG